MIEKGLHFFGNTYLEIINQAPLLKMPPGTGQVSANRAWKRAAWLQHVQTRPGTRSLRRTGPVFTRVAVWGCRAQLPF